MAEKKKSVLFICLGKGRSVDFEHELVTMIHLVLYCLVVDVRTLIVPYTVKLTAFPRPLAGGQGQSSFLVVFPRLLYVAPPLLSWSRQNAQLAYINVRVQLWS